MRNRTLPSMNARVNRGSPDASGNSPRRRHWASLNFQTWRTRSSTGSAAQNRASSWSCAVRDEYTRTCMRFRRAVTVSIASIIESFASSAAADSRQPAPFRRVHRQPLAETRAGSQGQSAGSIAGAWQPTPRRLATSSLAMAGSCGRSGQQRQNFGTPPQIAACHSPTMGCLHISGSSAIPVDRRSSSSRCRRGRLRRRRGGFR